jgi:hypothetical protein
METATGAAALLEQMQADANAPAAPNASAATMKQVIALAVEQRDLAQEKDALEEHLKGVQARLDEIRKRLLPDAMRSVGLVNAAGKGSFTLEDGSKVHLTNSTFFHVKAEHRADFYAWLRSNGNGGVVVEYVHPSTQKATLNTLKEEGVTLPDWITQAPETTAVLTRAKPAKASK